MIAEIVSPERVLYEGEAEMVVCNTVEGEAAFLEGHEPYLAMLKEGNVRVVNGEEQYTFKCSRGFVAVDGKNVRVISDDAMPV